MDQTKVHAHTQDQPCPHKSYETDNSTFWNIPTLHYPFPSGQSSSSSQRSNAECSTPGTDRDRAGTLCGKLQVNIKVANVSYFYNINRPSFLILPHILNTPLFMFT